MHLRMSIMLVVALVAALVVPFGALSQTGAAQAVPAVERIDDDQVGAAVQISRSTHADASAPVVYLANSENTAEGLSAGAAAAKRGGVLLWTPRSALDARVADELRRLTPSEIVVLAGTRGVTAEVTDAVRALGFPVTRIAKGDRFSASRAIVAGAYSRSSTAFIVSGWMAEDAASASAAAAAAGAPVIAVNGTHPTVDDLTIRLMTALGVTRVVIVGSTSSVTRRVVDGLRTTWPSIVRYGASDSGVTSALLARARFSAAESAVLTTARAVPGALSMTARGAAVARPVYLGGTECVKGAVIDDLARLGDPPVTLPGNLDAIPEATAGMVRCFDPVEDAAALRTKLEALVRELPGSHSVTVHVLGDAPRSVSVGGAAPREPASVIKIFAAYAILARVDSGQFSLDSRTRSGVTIRNCLRVMIHISDNLCHADLLALVGNDAINAQLYRAGFRQTYYVGVDGSGVYRSAKKATTDDIAQLLRRLDAGTLLSAASTDRLRGLLDEQLWKAKVPSGVALGVLADNKTGSLWTTTGMMQGDAGIVDAPGAPYVIAVLGESNATVSSVRAVSAAVYDHLEGEPQSYMAYPDRNLVTREATPYYSGRGTGRLGTIATGVKLIAESSSRTWYRVQYDGEFVFVYHSYVRTRY